MAVTTVSWSEIDTYRQCPFKQQLAYQERWKSPETGETLSRGILWHEVLEVHYKTLKDTREHGLNEADALSEAKAAVEPMLWDDRRGSFRSDMHELVDWMYQGYVDCYGGDSNWKILAVEHAPEVALPTETGGRSSFKLKMKIDLIVKLIDEGTVWCIDHKSHKDIPKDKELGLDDQFGLYTWGLRELGKPVHGAMYSTARTYKLKTREMTHEERFDRQRLYRGQDELDRIAIEAYQTARLAYGFKWEGDAPRHPNKDTCRWRCDFTDACIYGRKGMGDTREFLRDMGYVIDKTRH